MSSVSVASFSHKRPKDELWFMVLLGGLIPKLYCFSVFCSHTLKIPLGLTKRIGNTCQPAMIQHQCLLQNLVDNSHLPSAHIQHCPSPPFQIFFSYFIYHYVHLYLWKTSVLKGTLWEWKPLNSFSFPGSPHQHLEQDFFYFQKVFCDYFICPVCLLMCFKECLGVSGSERVECLWLS